MAESETPNRILRPWQQTYAKHKCFELDDMAEMALLSDKQIEVLSENSDHLGLGDLAECLSSDSLSMLRIYALMSSRQRTEVFSGGTPVSAFTNAQMAALRLAINDDYDYDSTAVKVGIYKNGKRIDTSSSRERRRPGTSLCL